MRHKGPQTQNNYRKDSKNKHSKSTTDVNRPKEKAATRCKTATKGLRTNHKEMPEDKRDGDETTTKRGKIAAKRQETTRHKRCNTATNRLKTPT